MWSNDVDAVLLRHLLAGDDLRRRDGDGRDDLLLHGRRLLVLLLKASGQ